jgi:PHD/YefM family antitoxin component YafN of YafNO toxin-antitoxin module
MTLTLTELRADLYKVVDQIIETGVPIEVLRHGHKIKIILDDAPSKLERLIYRENVINGNLEDLIHLDWLSEWSEVREKNESSLFSRWRLINFLSV